MRERVKLTRKQWKVEKARLKPFYYKTPTKRQYEMYLYHYEEALKNINGKFIPLIKPLKVSE